MINNYLINHKTLAMHTEFVGKNPSLIPIEYTPVGIKQKKK